MAAQTPENSRRAIAVTSFDFLNGSYKKAATARLVSLMIVGAVLVGALLIFAHGTTNTIANRAAVVERDASHDRLIASSMALTQASSSGGLNEADMLAHLATRGERALKVAGEAAPVATLLSDLSKTAPEGTSVTSVTLGDQPAAGGSTPTPAPAPSTGADAPAATAPAVKEPVPVTITVKAPDYSYVKPWISELNNVSYLQGTDTVWDNDSEEGGGLIITTTATLTEDAPSPQLSALETQLGIELDSEEEQ